MRLKLHSIESQNDYGSRMWIVNLNESKSDKIEVKLRLITQNLLFNRIKYRIIYNLQMSSNSRLKPDLSTVQIIFLSLFGGLGTGILFSPIGMIAVAGSGSFIAWVFGGTGFLLIALVIGEMTLAHPEAGGPARWLLYTHGASLNLISALTNIVYYVLIPPLEALAVVEALNNFTHSFLNNVGNPTLLGGLVGTVLVLTFIPFNYFGVKRMGQASLSLGIIKLILFLVIPIGLVIAFFNSSNFVGHGGFLPFGISGVFVAMPLAMFAFSGVRFVPDFAEEIRNKRKIILALAVILISQTVLFILFTYTTIGSLNWAAIGISPGSWSSLSNIPGNPYIFLGQMLKSNVLLGAAIIAGILSPFVAGYIYLGGGVRILFASARSSIVSKYLKELNTKYTIPSKALFTFAIIGAVLVFISAPAPGIFHIIVDITAAEYFSFAVIPVAMESSRRLKTTEYRIKGGSIFAAVSFIFISLVIFWSGWPADPYTALLILAGALIFGLVYKVRGEFKNSIWFIVYIFYIVGLSYIGSDGALNLISFNITSLIIAVTSLAFYWWGIHARLQKPYLEPTTRSGESEATN